MRAWIVIVLVACGNEPARESTRDVPGAPATPRPEPAAGSANAIGSGARDSSRVPQPFQEQAENSAKPAEANVLRYRATWANVVSVSPGCWFFSGPNGRDTPLGDRIVVRIEDNHGWMTWDNASFEGTWSPSSIDVFRLAKHDYQGAWVISERLVGTVKEKGIHAKYTYNECADGTKCPGECSIKADVLLVEERSTP